ncbi:MAG: RNA-binding transcriptional accessory protein [Lentimicrobiaceae bacterium]|jgi:uncharacterized protein|nr:RNA-binding transcriptional accessory protein [Lentimicrobiaceae bacterium]
MSEFQHFVPQLAAEFQIDKHFVANLLMLFSEGSTIPFIARYRKERTGAMDEETIANIGKRVEQLDLLEKRKEFVLNAIKELEQLTPALEKSISEAKTLQEVEDLYAPYKPKRRTKATIARERGLEPLAKKIMAQYSDTPEKLAASFVNPQKEIHNEAEALAGARDIIAEWVSENIQGRNKIRHLYHHEGVVSAVVVKDKEEEGKKYSQYFDWNEPISKMPSHRLLALLRAEEEGILKLKLKVDVDKVLEMLDFIFVKANNESAAQVQIAIDDSWKRLLQPSIETEIRSHYKEQADQVAIKVFSENVRQLLLAPPMGQKRVLALDPGFRTGCKLVILNEQGDLLHNETIFPHPPVSDRKGAVQKLKSLVNAYKIEVIAIGNGTAGRETEDFVRSIPFDRELVAVMVNESGASIYSASKVARDEFPDYDITVRGAVSIGRRLMDPLAELVKIDPKSIGVGQYQHDVNQKLLGESLNHVVESCVNAVGVDLNTASEQLLSYVSGLGTQLASGIIKYRTQNGSFRSRKQLLKVPRLGEKAFEQSAGFLRIKNAENPLDDSAVHPESYFVVEKMAKKLDIALPELIGNKTNVEKLNPNDFVETNVGKETITDILSELEKPGRDPRKSYEMVAFDKNIRSINDLSEGMILDGIVTNITAFGAFIDIGVHQDGLVHLSQLADRFVRDPNEIVKLNQHVKVRVTSVDVAMKRIGLSMKPSLVHT